MNKEFFTIRLSEIADVIAGQSPESIYYSNTNGVPFLQGNRTFGNLYPTIDTYTSRVTKLAKKGDVLMSVRAPVGDLNYAPLDLCIGRGLASIRSKSGNNEFIYYALKYNIRTLLKQGSGTTFDSVNKDIINDFELIIPESIHDRENITKVLSTLDEKIELNKKINEELESMAKALYDYWFVQFDFPNENEKPYKASGGKMIWSEELKREIPEGWEVTKLGKKFKTSLGGTPSTKINEYWNNGEFYWLNSGEISNFPIIESELKITKTAIESSATSLLPKGTVMLSITRHLRPSILGVDACANQSVVGIKELGDIKCYFLYPYLVNEIPRLMEMRTGAQQPHINKEIVDESYILLPHESSKILKDYNKLVGSMFGKIFNISFQTKKLVELREWLLPMLMNGQVKVN